MRKKMYEDEGRYSLGVALKKRMITEWGTYSCSMIRADLIYHGAKYYHKASRYISENSLE